MSQNTEQKNRDFSQVRIGTIIGFDRSWQMITAGKAYPVRFIECGVITFRDDDDCNHNIMENFFRANAYIIGQPDENYEPPVPVLKAFAETLLQNTEQKNYDPDAYMAREHVSPSVADTEQNVRTRDEQVAELTRELKESLIALDSKLRVELLEAEARGAAEQRRKDAELSRAKLFCQSEQDASDRTPERPDVVQWQKERNEFFLSSTLEVVTEYAAWRDKKDTERQEPPMPIMKAVAGILPNARLKEDILVNLLETTDAFVWAGQFNAIAMRLGYSSMDINWLTGWFANAMGVAELRTIASTALSAELNKAAAPLASAEQRRKDAEGVYQILNEDGEWSSVSQDEYLQAPYEGRRLTPAALETRIAELEEKLKRAERWAEVAHQSCMGTGPKQALGETLNGLHQFLRAALTREGGV